MAEITTTTTIRDLRAEDVKLHDALAPGGGVDLELAPGNRLWIALGGAKADAEADAAAMDRLAELAAEAAKRLRAAAGSG